MASHLKRSDSAKTTLSMYASRKTKYQKLLSFINVALVISSLLMIFAGQMLTSLYHMEKLDFISVYFMMLPWGLTGLGIVTFVVSIVGFVFSNAESKPPLMAYSVTVSLLVLVTFGLIFSAIESRALIRDERILEHDHMIYVIRQYDESKSFRSSWDVVQRRLRCCGAQSFKDYSTKSTATNLYSCVPNSCCVDNLDRAAGAPGCIGEGLQDSCRRGLMNVLWEKIYVLGCLNMLHQLYLRDLESALLVGSILSFLVVSLEICAIALSAAFVAQITRRNKRMMVADDSPLRGISLEARL